MHVKTRCADGRTRAAVQRAVLRHGLDRRKIYGTCWDTPTQRALAVMEWVTLGCSGCSCDCGGGYPCSHGHGGCHECGYTGKRRVYFAAPVIVNKRYVRIGRKKDTP